MGRLPAASLPAVLRGAPTRPFNHKSLGALASIGHIKGATHVFGVPMSGLLA